MGMGPSSLSEILSMQARTCVTCVLYKLRQAKNFILRIFTDNPASLSLSFTSSLWTQPCDLLILAYLSEECAFGGIGQLEVRGHEAV